MSTREIKFIVIDLFAGAGGTTTGIEQSGVATSIAAVNHDPVAIETHRQNHPAAVHFIEDIRTFNVAKLRSIVADARRQYPQAKLVIWASPDCTHFSRAKSGPKNRDTRSLAEHLDRYVAALRPDAMLVENVEEFTSWGPLDEKGRPLSRHEGCDYMKWVRSIGVLGYDYQYRILNAADYGAHQARRRYFGLFYNPHTFTPAWPEPTHAKAPVSNGLFSDSRAPWRPVREVLDLHDWGRSIFERQKSLVDKTLRRIINGLLKFGTETQIMHCNTPGYCSSAAQPCGTITAAGHKAVVRPVLLSYYSTGSAKSIELPSPTVTGNDRFALATPVQWINKNYGSAQRGVSIETPAHTVTASPKLALATAFIINPQYNNKGNSINQPSPVVVASQGSNPLSLAVAEIGESPYWQHQHADSATMRELRDTMRRMGIGDIYLRMLHEHELAVIQGFPREYRFSGTSRHRKKQIGNAVISHVPKAWFQSLAKANTL